MGFLDSILDASPHSDLPSGDVSIYTSIEEVPVEDFGDEDGDNAVLAPNGEPTDEEPKQFVASKVKPKTTRLVPFIRSLKQGMTGKDIVAVKRALYRAEVRKLKVQTPVFGPILKSDLKKFQKAHKLVVDGEYGLNTHKALAKYFDDYGVWLLHHTSIQKAPTQRERAVATAILGYNKNYLIHYTQGSSRMYGVRHRVKPPNVPPYEDCSSFVTWCYWVAGAPDPNHLNYSGYGFTGTLASHGVQTYSFKPGDLCFYGYGPPYSHVTIYIGNNRAISHGSERGPNLVVFNYRRDYRQTRSYL